MMISKSKTHILKNAEVEKTLKRRYYDFKNYSPNKIYLFNVGYLRFYEDVTPIKNALLEQNRFNQLTINRAINIKYDYRNGFPNVPILTPVFKVSKLADKKDYSKIKKVNLADISPKHALKVMFQKRLISKNRLRKLLKHNYDLTAQEKQFLNAFYSENSKAHKHAFSSFAHYDKSRKAEKTTAETYRRFVFNNMAYIVELKKRTIIHINRIKESEYLSPKIKEERLKQIEHNIKTETEKRFIQNNKLALMNAENSL